jgi:hypothetical protein
MRQFLERGQWPKPFENSSILTGKSCSVNRHSGHLLERLGVTTHGYEGISEETVPLERALMVYMERKLTGRKEGVLKQVDCAVYKLEFCEFLELIISTTTTTNSSLITPLSHHSHPATNNSRREREREKDASRTQSSTPHFFFFLQMD